MSSDEGQTQAAQAVVSLSPHLHARAIVRLFQCQLCSYPLKEAITLPCGNSLCRRCQPPTFKRENITYPIDPRRTEGFMCPFRDCGLQHTMGDCSLDVTLNKVNEMVRSIMDAIRRQVPDAPLLLDEKLHWPTIVESSIDVMPRSRVLHGGRLASTYVFADMGELDYNSDVAYAPTSSVSPETIEALDIAVAKSITDTIRGELECQVCYSLMLDPLTTSCGHTFCRKCVARVLDHSNLCPICRRKLPMPPGVQAEPSNKRISMLLSVLFADQIADKIETADGEESVDDNSAVPLFPCTLAYPHMPTFLHIFEPRYRLMIRRAIENGSRRFGILAYNSLRRPQPGLGNVTFMQYGTMLNIQRVEIFPDGRSLIETTGIYRFKVVEHSMLDGYIVGRIQRIDDMSLAEEEAAEAQETSNPSPDTEDTRDVIDRMSTQQLLQYGLDFISSARLRSAPWLHTRVLQAYGQPPTDPALFPYWFASVLPISEDEKYLLIPTTSVRERLKMTARWIQRLEAATCNHDRALARTVLDSSSEDESDFEEAFEEDEINNEEPAPQHEDAETINPANLSSPPAANEEVNIANTSEEDTSVRSSREQITPHPGHYLTSNHM